MPEPPDSLPDVENTLPEPPDTLPEARDSLPEVADTVPGLENSLPGLREGLPESPDTVPDWANHLPESWKPCRRRPVQTNLFSTAPSRLMPSRMFSSLALPKLMRISWSGLARAGSLA